MRLGGEGKDDLAEFSGTIPCNGCSSYNAITTRVLQEFRHMKGDDKQAACLAAGKGRKGGVSAPKHQRVVKRKGEREQHHSQTARRLVQGNGEG